MMSEWALIKRKRGKEVEKKVRNKRREKIFKSSVLNLKSWSELTFIASAYLLPENWICMSSFDWLTLSFSFSLHFFSPSLSFTFDSIPSPSLPHHHLSRKSDIETFSFWKSESCVQVRWIWRVIINQTSIFDDTSIRVGIPSFFLFPFFLFLSLRKNEWRKKVIKNPFDSHDIHDYEGGGHGHISQ